MIWIESVRPATYEEQLEHTNGVVREMSDWMVRNGDIYQTMCDRWLEKRPICCSCDEHIQEERAVMIDGEMWCERCIKEHMVNVEDYIIDEDYFEE